MVHQLSIQDQAKITEVQHLQPYLNQMYTGKDQLFSRASCANCGNLATDPKDCSGCQNIICGSCITKKADGGKCKNCLTSFETVKEIHPVMKELYERATFSCIYSGCSRTNISYHELIQHITVDCQYRSVACPNSCGVSMKHTALKDHIPACPLEQVVCNACNSITVSRDKLRDHIDSDCPKANVECDRCHALYKASMPHDCIQHLYSLIMSDRQQVSKTFQQVQQTVQQSIVNLDNKFTEKVGAMGDLLSSFVSLNSQVASFSSQKLAEIQASSFIAPSFDKTQSLISSGRTQEAMGSIQQANPSLAVKKMDILGCKTGTFYFEYPKLTQVGKAFMTDENFSDRMLTKLEACIGTGIYSMKLHYSDGTFSPLIGGRDPTTSIQLYKDSNYDQNSLCKVQVRAWSENYLQALTFEDEQGGQLALLESENQKKGTLTDIVLKPGEKIIGIHGYCDSNNDLRGMGFIVTVPQ